ncbi:MAG: bifunctional riboflavin kinase/FAD synthetase [Bacteroidales bacterium]|nr:bifunctional riboflavin kinase/FAD synthetase [Bacteroidales bacterium]MBN2763299.1 bifunctional riboflavin kinase/FAD synthetase [Bacteroidales bacterium]
MNICNDISLFHSQNTVATIGIFDGVHIGHQLIIKRLKELAQSYGSETVVITLWPHPRLVLQPENDELRLLTTLDEKISIIRNHGIDHLLIIPFTREFAQTTYEEFIRLYLVEKVGARHVVVGYNHHFGKDRQGSFESLLRSSSKYGFSAERMNPVVINNANVSSSAIRRNLSVGNMIFSNEALGYRYFIQGEVVAGSKMGRKLGYPTANIAVNEEKKLIPRDGVYAVDVELSGSVYKGMANIGVRPTIEKQVHKQTLEVNIFNFAADIYGHTITVFFKDRIRNEIKFASVNSLIKQLDEDRKEIVSRF